MTVKLGSQLLMLAVGGLLLLRRRAAFRTTLRRGAEVIATPPAETADAAAPARQARHCPRAGGHREREHDEPLRHHPRLVHQHLVVLVDDPHAVGPVPEP